VSSDGNPYKSPQKVEQSGVGHGPRWANMVDASAIIKAVAIAVVALFAIGVTHVIVLLVLEANDIVIDYMIENSYASKVFYYVFFCLGLFPDVIGGYFAAAIAGRNFLLHGIVVGIVLVAIEGMLGLLIGYLRPSHDPFTFKYVMLMLFTVSQAAVGGAIRQWIQRRKDRAK